MSCATTTHCVRTDPGPQRRASGAGAHRYNLISRSVSSGAIRKELCASVQNGAKMEEMARKSKIGRRPCRSKASLAHGKFVAGSLASGSCPLCVILSCSRHAHLSASGRCGPRSQEVAPCDRIPQFRRRARAVTPSLPHPLADCARQPAQSHHRFSTVENRPRRPPAPTCVQAS